MRKIFIFVESRFRVNRKRIKKIINDYFDQERLRGETEVSIAIVGDRKMKRLNKKYRGKNETTTVLSFSLTEDFFSSYRKREEGFVTADHVLRLGDIVISYPQAVKRAAEDQVLVDDKIKELILHGLNNLMGKKTNYGILS